MSVIASIGLAAAERLEHSMGPSVALRSYKALLSDDDGKVIIKASLGALRCALALDDPLELEQVAAFWQTLQDAYEPRAIAKLCHELVRARRWQAAMTLAQAEAARTLSPEGWYLLARVTDLAGDSVEALREYQRAIDASERAKRPNTDVVTLARLRQLEVKLAGGADGARLAALASQIEPKRSESKEERLDPAQKLVVAQARLRASSPYERASALSTLAELAAGGRATISRAAIWLAVCHADELGPALSWVEAERIMSALAHWPDVQQRELALAGLSARRRISSADASGAESAMREAFDTLPAAGRYLDLALSMVAGTPIALLELESDANVIVGLAGCGLNTIVALRGGDHAAARRSLSTAHQRYEVGNVVPAALWTAVQLALRAALPRAGAVLRGPSVRLAAALLERPSGSPPRGFCSLGEALLALGEEQLGSHALREAALRRESTATDKLVTALAGSGWDALEQGRRGEALALLQEARQLDAGMA